MARTRKRPKSATALALQSSHQEQCDYRASKRETKLRPRPRGISSQGSSADWHFRRDTDHLWVGELGREYDRNTPVGKRMLNMIVDNVLQDKGFGYNPDTGDEGLDKEAKHYIDELFGDPQRIDLQGEHDFYSLSKIALRDIFAAGDTFSVFNEDGPIELREFHRCRQPFNRGKKHKNNVLGVELTEQRKRLGYWFTKDTISPLDSYRIKHSDLELVEAWDVSGDWKTKNVLHLRRTDRISQTRGVSMFAPIFDYLGMFEDSQFQMMVKQQLSNMLLLIRERGTDFKAQNLSKRLRTGVDSEIPAGTDRLLEELYPGAELHGFPDETIKPWSPTIPNNEWFNHMKLVLRVMAIAEGFPYVLLMLDTADTNFHGYRGAVVEARNVLSGIQRWFSRQYNRPVVKHYLHRWADEDPAVNRFRERSLREAKIRRGKKDHGKRLNLFRHSWTLPGWASVDDLKDATADEIRLGTSTTDRDTLASRFDMTGEQMSDKVVGGNRYLWMAAVQAVMEDMKKLGFDTSMKSVERWASRYAPMPNGARVQLSMSLQDNPAPEPKGATE